MNHTFSANSANKNDDDLFLDVQIEQEEIFTDNNHTEINFTPLEQSSSSISSTQKNNQSNSLKAPFSWIEITKQRLNVVSNGQRSYSKNQQNIQPKNPNQSQAKKYQFVNLEKIKTKTMAIVITVGMLPLLLSSGVVYYFGNQAIKKQEIYNQEHQTELLQKHLDSQKRTLLFWLIATEITALLLGVVSALWTQRALNKVARSASKTTSLAIKAEQTKQSQILAKIVLTMRQSIGSEDIMASAVLETRQIFQCDRVIIYQFGQPKTGNILAESVDPRFCEMLLTYTEDLGLESKYLSEYQEKQCKVINNIYQEPQLNPEHLSQYESLDIKSCLHAPIEKQGEIIGLLIAYQCSDFRSWRSKEIELFNQIAIEIGLALDDAQLISDCLNIQIQLQESSLWQDYLNDSLELIHSSHRKEDIFKIAVEETRRILKCDRAILCCLESPNKATIVAESVSSEYSQMLGQITDELCFETDYHQEPVQVIHDVEEASISPAYRKKLEHLGVKSLIIAPIIHQNQLYGFLTAHQCSMQRSWQELESKWFTQFAKQVGYSLDNAQLMVQSPKNISPSQSTEKSLIQSQLPICLQESKNSLENFSQKILAGVDAVTPIFKQLQTMAKSVEGLTNNINQTKLQTQQVEGILRIEHKNIDLTEDRLIDIQQNLRKIVVKHINLGQYYQEFIQAAEQIDNLAQEINQQIDKTNSEASRTGVVSESSLSELNQIINTATKQLVNKTSSIKLFLGEIQTETEQITTNLEKSEAKAFVGIEIAQETRQNLNQITTRNQEISQLIERITLAASIGEKNSQLAQQSLLEVANLANQAARKSLTAVNTMKSLTEFLEKL